MCMYVLQAIFSNTRGSQPWLGLKSSLGIGALEYLVGGSGVPLASCDWTLGPHVVMLFPNGSCDWTLGPQMVMPFLER